jgi:hypothetical protein
MAYEQKNLIVGAAAVFISDDDSTSATFGSGVDLPAAVATDSMSETLEAAADWRNVGLTQEGIEVSYEPDFGEVEVDQILDVALMFKQGVTMTVTTTFAEATLENLLVVWGQPSSDLAAGVYKLTPGGLGDYPVERSLAFVGPGPRTSGNKERVYHLYRALVTDASAHALRRNENTAFPAAFRILPETSHVGQEYGTLTERTITAGP